MKNLLIYNPISGTDKNRDSHFGKMILELADGTEELMIYQTRFKGDASEYICNTEIQRFDKIICCGGDGTLHEVVNGIMSSNIQLPIGYIPQGTTNDYAKNLGISKENAIECIKKGKINCIDVGKFNEEYFNYVAAFGAFVNVSFSTPQRFKNMFGYCAYILEGIKNLTNITPKHIICKLNDQIIEDDIMVGLITNALSVAGISGLGQSATQLDDGVMEYLFIKMPKNILELQAIISLLINGKLDERYMYAGKFESLSISSEPMEWTLDGENGGCFEKAEIKVLNKAINIFSEYGLNYLPYEEATIDKEKVEQVTEVSMENMILSKNYVEHTRRN